MGCFQDTMVQSGPDEVLPLIKYGLYLCSSFSLVVAAKPGTPAALWLLHRFCTGDQSLSHLCCSHPLGTLLADHHSYMGTHLCNYFLAFPLCAQRHPWNANISHDFWIQVFSAREWSSTEKIILSKMSEPSISAFSELQWHRAQLKKSSKKGFTKWSTSRENKEWGRGSIHRSCHDLFAVTWIYIKRLAATSPISFRSDCLDLCWYLRPGLLYLNLKDM